MSEKVKQCYACGKVKPVEDFVSYIYGKRLTARCSTCRLHRRQVYRQKQAGASVKDIGNRRCFRCWKYVAKGEVVCHDHMDEWVDSAKNKDSEAVKVYEYTYSCVFCSRQYPARYTKEKAKLIQIAMSVRCPHCGGLLSLQEDGKVVGKIYNDLHSEP